MRPNPTFFADWEYLPLSSPPGISFLDYLHDSTEGDIGLSYLFERGQKRQHRLEAAKDATAVTRSQVADNERTLAFQVAQLFVNAQLAESTLELARQDLKSFQDTVNISERQYESRRHVRRTITCKSRSSWCNFRPTLSRPSSRRRRRSPTSGSSWATNQCPPNTISRANWNTAR